MTNSNLEPDNVYDINAIDDNGRKIALGQIGNLVATRNSLILLMKYRMKTKLFV
jgi:hypothetical protein